MKTFFYIICILLLLSNSTLAQEKTGFAIDPGLNNVAVLFTMTNEEGRIKNLELMESVFKDKSLGFTCEKYHNVSSSYIYNKLTEVASKLEQGATLLLYFNSHGGGSGDRFGMTAQGGSFKFSKALDALKKSNKKIKRLIILVDTCHAEGSIQDALGEDGDLLKNIKLAQPTKELIEISDRFSYKELPFTSFFVEYRRLGNQYFAKTRKNGKIDFREEEEIYEEILIISSCSVEDLSIRGVFAERFAKTFKEVKNNRSITVEEFLKKFAEGHSKSGQQPHYKIIPSNSMFSELLFGPNLAQKIPIKDKYNQKFNFDYILIPN